MSTLTKVPTMAWLLSGQIKEDEPVRNIRVERQSVVVGRHSSCDLIIPCASVSGTHARLTVEGDKLSVTDLQSTNGTFLNGVRINQTSPVQHGDLVQFAQVVLRARIDQQQSSVQTLQDDAADRALALIQFDKLISERAVAPHYQPIVRMDSRDVFGYELLGRSRLFGLKTPKAMFTAAAVLDMEAELSRVLRSEGARQADKLPHTPLLFVNTHPSELAEPGLLEFSLRELREIAPDLKLVLEIHEAAVTELGQMRSLRAALRDLDIGLAYDDFGAGQARLVELVDIPPDYLKFDMCLVRDIHQATPDRQRMLATLVKMVNDLGIAPLAEGIELAEEHEMCLQLGFGLAQGFLYGKPDLPWNFPARSLVVPCEAK